MTPGETLEKRALSERASSGQCLSRDWSNSYMSAMESVDCVESRMSGLTTGLHLPQAACIHLRFTRPFNKSLLGRCNLRLRARAHQLESVRRAFSQSIRRHDNRPEHAERCQFGYCSHSDSVPNNVEVRPAWLPLRVTRCRASRPKYPATTAMGLAPFRSEVSSTKK